MKKAIVTFITYDTFETIIPDEVYETGDEGKAVEIAQKQMFEELGYICGYDETDVEFVNEED